VPQDKATAIQWYRKAAQRGSALAQYQLGRHLCEGDGVPIDRTEGLSWLRKAAQQNDSDAQTYLRRQGL
jgi:uncharacterized protein